MAFSTARILELNRALRKRRLDAALVFDEADVLALTGIRCDSACLLVEAGDVPSVTFHTDFRYEPMVRRVAPDLRLRDVRRIAVPNGRVGVSFAVSHGRIAALGKGRRNTSFVDIAPTLSALRAVKTPDEIARIRAAEALDCDIWEEARRQFRPGMSERDMARLIKRMMIDLGDGEAFETIVCVGANAAECHHVPDDTVWSGRESVLVDMGVKLNGVCSDLTRNVVPPRIGATYRRVYDVVRRANEAAIAAARPGMTGRELDAVARDLIEQEGFGACFGHSLGHGVGYEIHEAPTASRRSKAVLKPGMCVTIEPGVYLEGNLGVRIEDLVLITETGCEMLSRR